jgi:hypothetical protein
MRAACLQPGVSLLCILPVQLSDDVLKVSRCKVSWTHTTINSNVAVQSLLTMFAQRCWALANTNML